MCTSLTKFKSIVPAIQHFRSYDIKSIKSFTFILHNSKDGISTTFDEVNVKLMCFDPVKRKQYFVFIQNLWKLRSFVTYMRFETIYNTEYVFSRSNFENVSLNNFINISLKS